MVKGFVSNPLDSGFRLSSLTAASYGHQYIQRTANVHAPGWEVQNAEGQERKVSLHL